MLGNRFKIIGLDLFSDPIKRSLRSQNCWVLSCCFFTLAINIFVEGEEHLVVRWRVCLSSLVLGFIILFGIGLQKEIEF